MWVVEYSARSQVQIWLLTGDFWGHVSSEKLSMLIGKLNQCLQPGSIYSDLLSSRLCANYGWSLSSGVCLVEKTGDYVSLTNEI